MDKEKAIKSLLARNVEEIIDKKHLEQTLSSGKKLRIKHGIDPTGDKIHIGRAVALWKLREFQDLGHKIVLIIGDFTAQIGDPSDKLSKRPFLAKEQIKKNLKNYLPQIGKIIDIKKTEVRHNSEWLSKLDFRETAELAESFSVNQMLRRRAFKERFQKEEDISLREFLYPIMQGYDSVAVKADVEIGGEDQLFNLMAGRVVQKHYGQKEQDILTVQMLMGLDGRKMSTSWGNVINITDSPDEQFGKIMSMHDDLIAEYFELATYKDWKEEKRAKGESIKMAKQELACEIVGRYHGAKAAEAAREKWEKLFSKKDTSVELPKVRVPDEIKLVDLIILCFKSIGLQKSKSQASKLISQGGVEIDTIKQHDIHAVIKPQTEVIKIGRYYFRLLPNWSVKK